MVSRDRESESEREIGGVNNSRMVIVYAHFLFVSTMVFITGSDRENRK